MEKYFLTSTKTWIRHRKTFFGVVKLIYKSPYVVEPYENQINIKPTGGEQMENKDSPIPISETEFLNLLLLAKQNDSESILRLLEFFKEDILILSQYINIPREDAIQSIILELIELFRKSH